MYELRICECNESGEVCHECHASIVWDLQLDLVAEILAYPMGEVRYERVKLRFLRVGLNDNACCGVPFTRSE